MNDSSGTQGGDASERAERRWLRAILQPLLAVILGGVLSLGGVALSSQSAASISATERRDRERQELKALRVAAYAKYFPSLNAYTEALSLEGFAEKQQNAALFSKTHKDLLAARDTLSAAVSECRLVGSPAINEILDEMDPYLFPAIDPAPEPELGPFDEEAAGRLEEALGSIIETRKKFLSTARRELGTESA